MKSERIIVKGVAFELTRGPDGRISVRMNGRPIEGHLEVDDEGRYRVSILPGRLFQKKARAIYDLAYWYTRDNTKRPLHLKQIKLPDGSTFRAVHSQPDNALQLTLWQIEVKVEEARRMVEGLSREGSEAFGKSRVYKTEIGLKVHRSIELMFKVLLGSYTESNWTIDKSNYVHWLSLLYDKLQTKDPEITARLDGVFQQTVMVHGDPKFGSYGNPMTLDAGDGWALRMWVGEEITNPQVQHLRGHLVLLDLYSTYSQAYLGDAVQMFSEAYLRYMADADPYLSFIETSMVDVVRPAVERFLAT